MMRDNQGNVKEQYVVRITGSDKYGKEKLLAILESLKNKEKFISAFQNIYGFEFTKENLIENLKE